MSYSNSFFDIIRPGCKSSAKLVVPKVIERLGPINNVIDVGCGEGWWANEFEHYGAKAIGIDNFGCDSPNKAILHLWVRHDIEDLSNLDIVGSKFDLAICLEVAEHLPERSAGDLVKFLCDASENILFSAAIPGQGGLGHINEQWPNYWIHKFNDLGYYARPFGFQFWGNPEVEPWYQQNMYLIQKLDDTPYPHQDCFPTIHPAFWSTRTGVDLP